MGQDRTEGIFGERKHREKWLRSKRKHCTFKESENSNNWSVVSKSGSMWGGLFERQVEARL